MSTLILPKTNIMLDAASQLDEIVSPLNKLIEIPLFACTRIYNDQSLIDVCNVQEAVECVYYDNNSLYEDLAPDICPEMLTGEYFLTECFDSNSPTLKFFHHDLKLTHILTMTKKCQNYYETFWFGSKEDTKFINFCLNNLTLLESFIQYFKNDRDARNLIQRYEQDKMVRYISDETKLRNKMFIEQQKLEKAMLTGLGKNNNRYPNIFYDEKTKRYYIPDHSDIYLTPREMDCFYWCVQGKTSDETALLLQISRKTVEIHLGSLKLKLGCYNKAALIRKAILLKIF